MTKDDLAKCPKVSEMLGRIYGNPKKALEDLRFSPDPQAIKLIEVWDSMNGNDQGCVPLEAVCLKAGVSSQEFLGMVFLMRQSLGKAESSLLAVNSFPEVVRKTIEFASTPHGHNDRKMLAQHSAIGFLPAPKGAMVSVNLFGSEASFADENDEHDADFDGFNDAFSGGDKELEEWTKNKENLLGDGK